MNKGFLSSQKHFAVFTLMILITAFVIAAIPAASAIGISPPRAKIDFVPDQRYDFSVNLINNNPFPVEVETRVEGILASSVAIKKPIRIPASGTVSVPISVVAPSSLPRPGHHTTYIFFAEKYIDEQAGTFAVRTEVGMQVIMWQPYPGNYAEIVASAKSIPQGEDTVLKLIVNNLGVEPIENGKATVRVTSAEGSLQDVVTFPNINLAGNTNQDYFEVIPSKNYKPGKYLLDAKLEYGIGNVSTMTSSFAVGVKDVDVIALEGPIYLDKAVNRYSVHIESLWNEPMQNVHAVVKLGSTPSQTPSNTIPPFDRITIPGFWETDSTVAEGQNLASVTVYFDGEEKDFLTPIQVIAKTPLPPSYEEPADTKEPVVFSAADVLFMLLGVIIVLLIVVFAIGRMRKHPPQNPPQNSASKNTVQTASAQNPAQPQPPVQPSVAPSQNRGGGGR